jgi:hypothetical protein
MYRAARLVVPGTCIAVILSSGPVVGQALAPSKPSQVVTLITATGEPCGGDPDAHPVNVETKGDGTFSTFTVPVDQVLVLTGISFSVSGGVSANHAKKLLLFGYKAPSGFTALFSTVVLTADTVLGPLGGGTATIPNAIVKASFQMCVKASEINGSPAEGSALVYGFLTKDN